MFKIFNKKKKHKNIVITIHLKGSKRPLIVEVSNMKQADRIIEQACNDNFIAIVSAMNTLLVNSDKIIYVEVETEDND